MKKFAATCLALTIVFSGLSMNAFAAWQVTDETKETTAGDTTPDIDNNKEIEWRKDGEPVPSTVETDEIDHWEDTDVVDYWEDGEPTGEFINGDKIDTKDIMENDEAGIKTVPAPKDSGNSGSKKGTPGNGQKFGSDALTQAQIDAGLTLVGKDNPTVTVPAGVKVIVRVQNNKKYSYVEVTGPQSYSTGGNNAWIYDVQEAKHKIGEEDVYDQIPVLEKIPVYKKEAVFVMKDVETQKWIKYVWVEDENGGGRYVPIEDLGGGSNTPDVRRVATTTIADEDVPLAPAPLTTIMDDDVPLADMPVLGAANVWVMLAGLAVSFAGFVSSIVLMKKRQEI